MMLDNTYILRYYPCVAEGDPHGKDAKGPLMTNNGMQKRYIVDEKILPEAILKTAQAKELLAKNPVLTINEAVQEIGISRSAFYKYRDGIFPFYEATKEKLLTLQINLDHQAGVLSGCLNVIAMTGANILTINQGIPLQGIARVTVAFEAPTHQNFNLELLLEMLYDISGVINVELIGQN